MTQEAVTFLRKHRDRRFFLYFAPTIPHVALQIPDDEVKAYYGHFPEVPYHGNKGYLPHKTPRAAYAAMITHLDTSVGRILDTLREIGQDEDTVVFFTSDNGATFDIGGAQTAFFDSDGGLRGAKTELYEGGIRAPMIVRWPTRIRAGTTSDHVGANWDMWATFAELIGSRVPDTDGISFAPTLFDRGRQARHKALYWEYHSKGSAQAVRMGRWKAVRTGIAHVSDPRIELYDLERDPYELTDVSTSHPKIVLQVKKIMRERTPAVLAKWNVSPMSP